MKYLKKIEEDKILKFSEYEPKKYNGTILVNNIMEWLRSYFLDKSDSEDLIRIPMTKFIDETNIDIDQLRTFVDEQEKTGRIDSFKIKFEDDLIIFYDFKKDNSKKVWEETTNESTLVSEFELDELLDKIAESGIETLNDIDRKRLNMFSNDDKEIIELIDEMGDITLQFKELYKKMEETNDSSLMKIWSELNLKMVELERKITSYGIDLADPRLNNLMKKTRPDIY